LPGQHHRKGIEIKKALGYYPVLNGSIEIGNTNIIDLNLKWWRRQCGVVMQDGIIFSETIARNIAVNDGEIDKDCLLRAARLACMNAHAFILLSDESILKHILKGIL
jgi:ATP-binding cassette subfamily B protein